MADDHHGKEETMSSKLMRITNMLSKLQVADRAEAIVRARDAGLA